VTRSALWREFESADSLMLRMLRATVLVGGGLFLAFTGALQLAWPQQLILAILTILLALWMDRGSNSYPVTLTLMLLSLYSTYRYGFWRIASVMAYFRDPGIHKSTLNGFFICLLLLAECYAFTVLLLGYIQMLWPLRRKPVPLPDDMKEWPAVDVLIPTFNEPLSMVRFTALAAINIDWPADKLNVFILDDGRREEFRAFAEEAGIGYITRNNNRHAKAGNINGALAQTGSPFVAIFDSDHVPTRSFLQVTMGWFLRDRKLAILQTPHHFYSPDPFERNLGHFHVTPNEGELFYGVVQDGNDFWNAAFFCGSCAVIRRSALEEVGGIAVETVTEDAHTSLRIQMHGWNTAYLNIPQAAGLATEQLSGHVRQRIRWARGMVQVLHLENPLWAPGLKPAQRLCYFNAMSHFLYALPRLIFLTAPLIYLVLGQTNIPGYWMMILAYAAPHLVLSNVTNSRVQGRHRHTFWNEIYETVLAPYIFLPTMLALLGVRKGSFNVTAKGGVVNREFFDTHIARPYFVLLAFNLLGLLCAVSRAIQFPTLAVAGWLSFLNWPARMYDGGHPGTILMNVLWTLFNIVLLGVAIAVARESRQRRLTVRMERAVPSDLLLSDGSVAQGITSNLSNGGVQARMQGPIHAEVGDSVRFVFPLLDGTATLPARVVEYEGEMLRAKFDSLNLQETEALTMILYSRADTWLNLREECQVKRPLSSLRHILQVSLYGLSQTSRSLLSRLWRRKPKVVSKDGLASSAVFLVLLGGLALIWPQAVRAAQDESATSSLPTSQSQPTAYDLSLLPLPFYNAATEMHPTVPIVFLSTPSPNAMRAAGIVASWFGVRTGKHAVRFHVLQGTIPVGNAIVIADRAAVIPDSLGMGDISGPTLAMRGNPIDPNSTVLVIAGRDTDELVNAAIGMTIQRDRLQGDQASMHDLGMPGPRQPDDAPRWLSAGWNPELGEMTQSNLKSVVQPSSILELTGTAHWAVLPDLKLFANAGYPFTRMADLAETSVVLTTQPSSGELEVFLDLMGHFGAQTGYPVLRVVVTDAAGMSADGKKDYLIVGSMKNQPALQLLNSALPISVNQTGLQIHDTQGFFHAPENAWWRVRSTDPVHTGDLDTVGILPSALIEEMEWPRGSERTAVVVLLRDATAAINFEDAFLRDSQSEAISQSVSVLHDTSFSSYRIGDSVYRVGSIPLLVRTEIMLAEFPWLIVLLAAIFCFLMATLLWAMVRRRARARLQSYE